MEMLHPPAEGSQIVVPRARAGNPVLDYGLTRLSRLKAALPFIETRVRRLRDCLYAHADGNVADRPGLWQREGQPRVDRRRRSILELVPSLECCVVCAASQPP